MPNKRHVERLLRGSGTWNTWRKRYGRQPDLSHASFDGELIDGANLRDVQLHDCTFRRSQLDSVNLTGSKAHRVDFSDTMLTDVRAPQLEAFDCTFIRTDASNVQFARALFERCEFLDGALFGCDFTGATLRDCSFRGTTLLNVTFRHTRLVNVDFGGSHFNGVILANTPLQGAQGLDEISHDGPSSVGLDTFFASRGLPTAFLRGIGTPDIFVDYAESLVGVPVQFSSCFISYSSADEAFVLRLRTDLLRERIRNWFAPIDLRIGDQIRDRIEESIRLHDKLLLVVSENSIASTWVATEVETALDRERIEGRNILFPIRIDDSVMSTDRAWAATVRRMRHIGDFSQWTEREAYDVAFSRLLRDLRREEATMR